MATPRACLVALTLVFGGGSPGLLAQTSSADYTEPYQLRAVEIYRDIIAMRTSAGHGQVPAMAEYLANVFREGGFPAEHVHVFPHISEAGEEIAAIVVQYPGDGSSGEGTILLTGHMDVVDALPEDWERDPFTLIEEGGYFFGRGTLDDKFGIAMLTATFLRLKEAGFVPRPDLVLGFTGDEETGMVSTRALVDEHRHLTDAAFALNADAGGGVYAYATLEVTVTNPGGHSSQPRLDNAIYELASALGAIQDHRFPVRMNDATRRYFEMSADLEEAATGAMMRRFAADPGDAEAADMPRTRFDLDGEVHGPAHRTFTRIAHALRRPHRADVAVVPRSEIAMWEAGG